MAAANGRTGRRWTCRRCPETDEWGVHIVDIDSGAVLLLPESTSAFSPTWSPDDTELAFKNRTGNKDRIVKRDLVTQLEAVLGDGKRFYLYEPDWRRF